MKNSDKSTENRTVNPNSFDELYWALKNIKDDFLKMKGSNEPEIICLEKLIDIFLASDAPNSPYRVYRLNLIRHEYSSYIVCDSAICIATDGSDEHYAVYEDSKKSQWDSAVFKAMKEFNKCKFTSAILEKLCKVWNVLNIKHLSCSQGQYAAFVIKYFN